MELRHVASLILLLTLAVDVTYGVVTLTLNSPYGCTARAVNQTTHTANETLQQSGDVNWKVLADPCFYIYYFGMLGGSALVISLMPAPKKKGSICGVGSLTGIIQKGTTQPVADAIVASSTTGKIAGRTA